jgi:hypothetical protein
VEKKTGSQYQVKLETFGHIRVLRYEELSTYGWKWWSFTVSNREEIWKMVGYPSTNRGLTGFHGI